MSRASTLISVATYNEIDNLPRLVDDILAVLPEAEILVIDDNSPDGTGQWCDARSAADCRLRCLHREGKLGLGTAIVAGMRFAIEHGYRYVINMDADFSHHPHYLPALLAGMGLSRFLYQQKWDCPLCREGWRGRGRNDRLAVRAGWRHRGLVLAAARDEPGREFPFPPAAGVAGARLQRGFSLLSHGGPCPDRFCPRSQPRLFVPGGDSLAAEAGRRRFGETPIVFVDRRQGASKISWREAASSLGTILRLGIEQLFSSGGLIRR